MSTLEEPKKIESILYQVCLWLILYPKTLFYILFMPKKSVLVALGEERGSFLLSPRIFWAITITVIGYFLYRKESLVIQAIGLVVNDAQSLVVWIVIIWSVVSGAFATIACKEKYGVIESTNLEPLFDAQCYLTAVFGIILFALYSLQNINIILISQILAVISLSWFIAVQIMFFLVAIKTTLARAVLLFMAGMGLWTALNYFWFFLPALSVWG